MKQINLLNWRNTKDKKPFNFFKKAVIVSFFSYLFLALVVILPLHIYKNKLLVEKKEYEFLLISQNIEIQELLTLINEQANSLDFLLKLENSQKVTFAFFNIVEKIARSNSSFKILRLNRIEDKLFIEAVGDSEKTIQKWLNLLQEYQDFKNVRLVDFSSLAGYISNTQTELLKFKLEIQLHKALQELAFAEVFDDHY